MTSLRPDSLDEWLTLRQASDRLGVHAATLRRWADSGAIPVFLTRGGHRRFRGVDVGRFEREHSRADQPTSPNEQWAEVAIAHTRQNIAEQGWLAAYDEAERSAEREVGRRLIGIMLQFAARADEGAELLSEARAIGEQYAQAGLRHGQSVTDLLRAISFFRGVLLEVTIPEPASGAIGHRGASARLLRRIERLMDEVQVGVVETYVGR